MARKDIIKIGVDLDGVIARHDLGGFWIWLRKLKEEIKKKHVINYYYPSNYFERIAWKVINNRRKLFVDHDNIFRKLSQHNEFHFYLITGRFKFLEELTLSWLEKHNLISYFRKVIINLKDIDPSIFKTRQINKLSLDYFIDDDLDTLNLLKKKTKTKLFWVVPKHKDKNQNNDSGVISSKDFTEALSELVKISKSTY